MDYLSICTGFGGAELAFDPLGWRCVAVSEIDPVASSVLAYRYPDIPNLGDFTKIGVDDVGPIDLLVGGTPCQSLSVAGLRGGLGDDRGNLALEFLKLAQRTRPRWILWENVPGVYSATSHVAPESSARFHTSREAPACSRSFWASSAVGSIRNLYTLRCLDIFLILNVLFDYF